VQSVQLKKKQIYFHWSIPSEFAHFTSYRSRNFFPRADTWKALSLRLQRVWHVLSISFNNDCPLSDARVDMCWLGYWGKLLRVY